MTTLTEVDDLRFQWRPRLHANTFRDALISGRWDPIRELLDNGPAIEAKAKALAYV